MSMQVTFGAQQTTNNFEAAASNYLKPWNIYNVKLEEFKFDQVNGKDGQKYDGLRIVFANAEGLKFDHFVFGVNKPEDLERKMFNDREMPSQFEVLRLTINHILGAFDPSLIDKVNKAISGKSITMQQYIDLVAKGMKPFIGKDCYIKIVGNKDNYATMPRIATVWNNGEEAVISNNFISKDESKLTFSNYEKKMAQEIQTRTPSTSSSLAANNVTNLEDSLEIPSTDPFGDDDLPF